MSLEIVIRDGKKEDIPIIHQMDQDVVIYVASLDNKKDLEQVKLRHGDVFERWLDLDIQKVFIAYKKDDKTTPVGFIWLVLNNEQFTGVQYCFVMDIGIKEKYRNMGVGKALMKKAMEYTRDQKCSKLKLMVNSMNKRAIRLYRELGFEVEDLYMKKEL